MSDTVSRARAREKRTQGRKLTVYGALAANVGIAIAKLVAALTSGSASMLAESVHSLADTGNELLLLVGLRLSRRPPHPQHPYGHGKESYFWGLLVAMLLFVGGGVVSLYRGVARMLAPEPVRHPLASFVVLGVALAFDGGSLAIGLRQLRHVHRGESLWAAFRHSKDPAVFAVVAEDSAGVAGAAMAFAGLFAAWWFGLPWLDGLGSFGIGAILCVVATVLMLETRGLLLGEAANPALVADVARLVAADDAVCSAGEPLTMHLGPDEILLNIDVGFRADLDMHELQASVERIESAIRRAHPSVSRVYLRARSLCASNVPASGSPA